MEPQAHARRSDPHTSHAAAKAVTPEITRKQQAVMAFARSRDPAGFTDLELEEHFHDSGSTYRTRRRELVDLGQLRDSGETMRHKGDTRHRVIWVLVRK